VEVRCPGGGFDNDRHSAPKEESLTVIWKMNPGIGEYRPMTLDAAKLATGFLERHLDSLLHGAASSARRLTSALRENLERTYAVYIRELLRQTNETKSFVVRDRPVPLSQIYVPVDLSGSGEKYPAVGVSELAEAYRPTLILGSAGTGKSLLMRHLALDAIVSYSYIPVLVELRRLSYSDITLRELIHKTTRDLGLSLSEDELSRVLKSGKLALLLDGFDEIPQQKRSATTLQMLELTSALYAQTPIIVSSRPEPLVSAWPLFRNLHICPLSLEYAIELVMRLPIDREVKNAFIQELQGGLYEGRRSFASNPLLLSIMVLTFSVNAYIPLKRSLFLDKAYDVLFEQHDALKPAFRRERTSGLDIDEFGKLFSAFSLLSYDDERTRFPESYARQLAEEASRATGISAEPEAFVHDASQAVSLLVRDGLELAYAHRSFQEYFVAKFIMNHANSSFRGELLDSYLKRAGTDEVLDLAFEINPRLIERDYLLKKGEPVKSLFQGSEGVGEATLCEFFIRIGLKISVVRMTVSSSAVANLGKSDSRSKSRSSGVQFRFQHTVEHKEFLDLCDLLVRLYYPREHSSRAVDIAENAVDITEIVRQTWREGGSEPVEWAFDGALPPILLTRLARDGGVFSLDRLNLVKRAVSQMEKNARREASARDLLEARRQSKLVE
jgi:hypothetical protein